MVRLLLRGNRVGHRPSLGTARPVRPGTDRPACRQDRNGQVPARSPEPTLFRAGCQESAQGRGTSGACRAPRTTTAAGLQGSTAVGIGLPRVPWFHRVPYRPGVYRCRLRWFHAYRHDGQGVAVSMRIRYALGQASLCSGPCTITPGRSIGHQFGGIASQATL